MTEHRELPGALDSLVHGGGRWVAFAGDSLHWSDDGVVWHDTGSGADVVYDVAYGGGRFIASMATGLATSVDGESWTPVETAPAADYRDGLAFVGDRFLLPARASFGDTTLYQSFDGLTWTDVATFATFYGEGILSAGPGGAPRIIGIALDYYGHEDAEYGVDGVLLGDDDVWVEFPVEMAITALACTDAAAIALVRPSGVRRAVGAPDQWRWQEVLDGDWSGDLLADGAEVIHAGDGIQRGTDDGLTWTEVLAPTGP